MNIVRSNPCPACSQHEFVRVLLTKTRTPESGLHSIGSYRLECYSRTGGCGHTGPTIEFTTVKKDPKILTNDTSMLAMNQAVEAWNRTLATISYEGP